MTRLLVSVRDAQEAKDALAAGAHLIDVKEPLRGALGAAEPPVWRAVQSVLGRACPTSVALGELLDDPESRDMTAVRGYHFAKLGLAGCGRRPDWPDRWRAALARLPAGTAPVAVAYVDRDSACAPDPQEVIRVGCQLGCRALLLDTFDKSAGTLFAQLPPPVVKRVMDQARNHQLLVVIGGSLDGESLSSCLALQPDYLAVRGAVCRGGRQASLDPQLVRDWVERLADASRDQCYQSNRRLA
jgi:uncharacterized protein (UPF0264 family)